MEKKRYSKIGYELCRVIRTLQNHDEFEYVQEQLALAILATIRLVGELGTLHGSYSLNDVMGIHDPIPRFFRWSSPTYVGLLANCVVDSFFPIVKVVGEAIEKKSILELDQFKEALMIGETYHHNLGLMYYPAPELVPQTQHFTPTSELHGNLEGKRLFDLRYLAEERISPTEKKSTLVRSWTQKRQAKRWDWELYLELAESLKPFRLAYEKCREITETSWRRGQETEVQILRKLEGLDQECRNEWVEKNLPPNSPAAVPSSKDITSALDFLSIYNVIKDSICRQATQQANEWATAFVDRGDYEFFMQSLTQEFMLLPDVVGTKKSDVVEKKKSVVSTPYGISVDIISRAFEYDGQRIQIPGESQWNLAHAIWTSQSRDGFVINNYRDAIPSIDSTKSKCNKKLESIGLEISTKKGVWEIKPIKESDAEFV